MPILRFPIRTLMFAVAITAVATFLLEHSARSEARSGRSWPYLSALPTTILAVTPFIQAVLPPQRARVMPPPE